jgi:hypothetical protein
MIFIPLYRGTGKNPKKFATFTFVLFFSARKQACGLEARAFRGKSIGGKRNALGDPSVLPQNEAGRSGVPNSEFGMWNSEFLGSFLPFRIPHSTFRISIARPAQEMRGASCFFLRNDLASRPGKAQNSIVSTPPWSKLIMGKL